MKFYVVFMLFTALFLLGCASAPQQPTETAYHAHADFKVFLNGTELNLSQEKYMAPYVCDDEHEKGAHIDLHGGNGGTVHVHDAPASWATVFSSLKMNLTNDCFELDDGSKYCGGLRFFVNGNETSNLPEKQIADLDKVLITTTQGDVSSQLASITSFACIESGKCPAPEGYVKDLCSVK